MERWDWIRVSDVAEHSDMPSTSIGEFLRRRVEPVDRKVTAFSEVVPISIHFNGSISRRVVAEGREYSLPMLWVRPGDIVLSKIDLKNGAVGVLPDDWPSAAVTTHFAVYEPDKRMVLPEFFRLLIQSPRFKAWLADNKSGQDGRTEVKLSDFEDLDVPLPDLALQNRLIAAYQKALGQAAQLDAEAHRIERDAQREFEAALGLTPPPNLPKRPFQIARFRDIERWSHEGILQDVISRTVRQESTFDQPALAEVATITHGCSRPPSAKPTGLEILKISAVTRGDFRPEEKKFICDSPELRARFDLRKGDILMCRTNGTLAYVGMAALVMEDMPDLIFPDKVIRVRLTTPALLPDFLWTLLKSPYMRMKIEANARTAVGNYAIGSSDLAALEVIAPPFEVQKQIASALRTARSSAGNKRKQAAALRATAWNDFIAAVFA